MDVNRKGRHKERNRKKEEPEKAAELQQQDVEEDAEVDEEENIYISDQEEEKRGFLFVFFWHFLSTVMTTLCPKNVHLFIFQITLPKIN